MTGLAGNSNIRLEPNGSDPSASLEPISIEIEEGGDQPEIDESGNILRIEHGDGTITVSLDGKPLGSANEEKKKDVGWFDNLAEHIEAEELSRISEDLLRGIADDLQSRSEWMEDRALGIKLLALKIEVPNVSGAADGAPVEGQSKVRHPLLLEAVLRFQANARSEFLPTDGPCKVRNDMLSPTPIDDGIANALQGGINHYLTAVATEYYPDTDRMLFFTGFGGDGFKKVYKCPMRRRPVSESIDAEDLIVNQAATDIANAQRVTHRSMMRKSVVRRMQLLKVYRQVDLSEPTPQQPDALEEEKASQQGITINVTGRPEDREREIYETCCELDIRGFEYKIDGQAAELAVPYVVTLDRSSRQVLSITRNYGEKDDPLPVARERFVQWPFVPGIGFYSIGLLHMMGNTTNAVTAAWREMLDNGMFANFPGFLMSDMGGRQNTTVFRVPPGGAAPIKTNGQSIRDAIMALPYSTAGMPALMTLVENMAETGRRIGGTAEVQVGEGRADVPVGTVMAMIDQAIKVMNAVHKRMHTAQARELQLFKQLFKEDPTSLIRYCNTRGTDREKLIAGLNNCDMVPQADPNTSSAGQRLMKIMGLFQLVAQAPNLYDPIKTHTAALSAMGWQDPDSFFVPPAARSQPPPEMIQAATEMQNKTKTADAKSAEGQARLLEAGSKKQEVDAKTQQGAYAPIAGVAAAPPQDTPADTMMAQAKLMDARTKARQVTVDASVQANENQNRDQDREARERESVIGLAKEVIMDPVDAASAGKRAVKIVEQIDKGLGQT